jgi:hypothetical protein
MRPSPSLMQRSTNDLSPATITGLTAPLKRISGSTRPGPSWICHSTAQHRTTPQQGIRYDDGRQVEPGNLEQHPEDPPQTSQVCLHEASSWHRRGWREQLDVQAWTELRSQQHPNGQKTAHCTAKPLAKRHAKNRMEATIWGPYS